MNIYLIRHAQTQGNIEHRYIGSTDQPLSEAGTASFCNRAFPAVERVYSSPMLRCRQTAQILYPMNTLHLLDDLRECDFGDFECKSYFELKDEPTYRAWIDSNGEDAPPSGEHPTQFKNRCCEAFKRAIDSAFDEGLIDIAFVVHGGTIMAVLERFALPHRAFYEWQPPNLGGWAVQTDKEMWRDGNVLTVAGKIENG